MLENSIVVTKPDSELKQYLLSGPELCLTSPATTQSALMCLLLHIQFLIYTLIATTINANIINDIFR